MSRQRACLFRALGAAHGAAREMRGQPRRLQRRRHLARRQALWPRMRRPLRAGGSTQDLAASAHPVLGVQLLPRPGRLRPSPLLSQRPVYGPPHPLGGRVRQELHGSRAALQTWPRIRARRRTPQHPAPYPALARRRRGRAGLYARLRVDAGLAGPGDSGIARHIRGSGAGGERALGGASWRASWWPLRSWSTGSPG